MDSCKENFNRDVKIKNRGTTKYMHKQKANTEDKQTNIEAQTNQYRGTNKTNIEAQTKLI